MALLARAGADGLVSAKSIPSWLSEKAVARGKDVLDKEEIENNLLLTLAITSMKQADGRPVKRKGASKEERYSIPPKFWTLDPKEKLNYVLKEGPPLDPEALMALKRFFTATGISIHSYETRYEPVSPPKPW